VLILTYFVYLWSQTRSNKYSYRALIELDDDEPDIPEMEESLELERPYAGPHHRRTFSYPRTPSAPTTPTASSGPSIASTPRQLEANDDPSDVRLFFDPLFPNALTRLDKAIEVVSKARWVSRVVPVALLFVSTGLIALCAGHLVDTIDHFVDHSPISKTMIGLIILPIVGNTAELISGIMFAWRKQMDLAFAVSIGSAIQIALFVSNVPVRTTCETLLTSYRDV
jgi:Ca2+:H+ antiporter